MGKVIPSYQRIRNRVETLLLPPSWARIKNIAQMRYYSRRFPEQVPYFPWSVDIEPTTRCNLTCPMCQLRAWTKPRRDLSLDEFKGIVNQFPGIAGIKLQGMGEPLLNAELIDMVRWADRKNIRVRTVTNGMLMDASMAKSLRLGYPLHLCRQCYAGYLQRDKTRCRFAPGRGQYSHHC